MTWLRFIRSYRFYCKYEPMTRRYEALLGHALPPKGDVDWWDEWRAAD